MTTNSKPVLWAIILISIALIAMAFIVPGLRAAIFNAPAVWMSWVRAIGEMIGL